MTRSLFSDATLDALRARGDPQADDVVADFVEVAGWTDARSLVQALIKHRRTLPREHQVPSVRAYFDDPALLPPWVDSTRLREGQEFFNVFGVHIASALFCASLPMSYTAVEGTQVLVRTAALVSDTRRRLAQTGEMLLDVMGANDPPGTEPFAPQSNAYRAPHGVRLFHAAVRHMLRNDPEYDRNALGEPINQEDLLGTLLAFTVVVVEALERFGVPVDCERRDAYLHLWLTTGSLLGIDPDLLRARRGGREVALGWQDMVDLRDQIVARNAGASAAGEELMAALLAEQSEALPFLLRGLPRACTRHLIGDTYCEYLNVPPAGWSGVLLRPLPVVNRLLFRGVYYDLSGWLFAKVTRNMYRAWMSRSNEPGPHPWRYESIEGPWRLERARTRAARVARHPMLSGRERRANGTAFAAR